jgi:hypothetical protein
VDRPAIFHPYGWRSSITLEGQMKKPIFGLLGAMMLGLAISPGAAAAPFAPGTSSAADQPRVVEAAWVTRCHTVWVRRHRHHHRHGWRRVPVKSCHRVRI